MNDYPTVSVIIPTKNEQLNILRCLKSIKKQNYPGKIEIIVVDNYSDDQTTQLAKTLADQVIIEGLERSNQRNLGAKSAQGKYLLFLDADMKLDIKVIRESVSIAQNSPQAIIAIKEFSQASTFWGKAIALERNCYQGLNLLTAARFFPRDAFLKLGGYDPKLFAAEDWDLTQRFLKRGYKLHITGNSLIFHYEPNLGLFGLLAKEIYYIHNINRYQKKHPQIFIKQASISYRLSLYLKSWPKLITHPLLTGAFLFYKLLVYLLWLIYRLAGAVG